MTPCKQAAGAAPPAEVASTTQTAGAGQGAQILGVERNTPCLLTGLVLPLFLLGVLGGAGSILFLPSGLSHFRMMDRDGKDRSARTTGRMQWNQAMGTDEESLQGPRFPPLKTAESWKRSQDDGGFRRSDSRREDNSSR